MIIDKIVECLTAEQKQQWDRINSALDAANIEFDNLTDLDNKDAFTDGLTAVDQQIESLMDALDALEAAAIRAYRAAKSDAEIVADVREVLDAITQEDYAVYLEWQTERYSDLIKLDSKSRAYFDMAREKELATKGYESCADFLRTRTARYLDMAGNRAKKDIAELVRQKALAWYPDGPKKPAKVMPIAPKRHVMPNSTFSNYTETHAVVNYADGFYMTLKNAKGNQREIKAYTMLEYGPAGAGLQPENITEYERQVTNAVCSLYDTAARQSRDNPTVFTVDSIYRAMPHGNKRPGQRQTDAIIAVMDKFTGMDVTFDPTDYLRARGIIKPDAKFKVESKYFVADKGTYTTNNGAKETVGYAFYRKPVVLEYAEMTGQILTVKPELIEMRQVKDGKVLDKPLTMNEDRQAIVGNLIRRIKIIKDDTERAQKALDNYNRRRKKNKNLPEKTLDSYRNCPPVILFDTLFGDTGTYERKRRGDGPAASEAGAERVRATRDRKFIYQALDYWKALGYIADYHERREGQNHAITGVEIEL